MAPSIFLKSVTATHHFILGSNPHGPKSRAVHEPHLRCSVGVPTRAHAMFLCTITMEELAAAGVGVPTRAHPMFLRTITMEDLAAAGAGEDTRATDHLRPGGQT
jgi:hypothetical protein